MTTRSKIEPQKPRSRISQSDVPAYSLEQTLRIPNALYESCGGQPTSPLRLASAMNVQPSSGPFRALCGASIAYGFTEGGCKASEIKLTPLAQRIVRPTIEGDDHVAKREALLKPRIIQEFLTKYNSCPLPKDNIAQNVLNDMGVPLNRTAEVLSLIIESAEALGLITEIKEKRYIDLSGVAKSGIQGETDDHSEQSKFSEIDPPQENDAETEAPVAPNPKVVDNSAKLRRVFVTHGKNKEFVEPIRQLLTFGEMEAVVSVEKQSVSQPVPDKVMNDMRDCGAAIIHVEDEMRLKDKSDNEQVVLNPNVLIEIGAAMALYRKRFILLVKEGVNLPSNLQGLFEVRYSGSSLDGAATIKLLQAINEMKKESA